MGEKTRELTVELFGKKRSFEYSEKSLGYSIIALRVVMGWVLFYAGITKVLDPSWTAKGYLANIPAANPFNSLWASMAGNPLIDYLVMWGLTLTGLGIIIGALVRWNSFWGAVMMLFFWLSSFPLKHSIIIDDHLVYAALLFGLGAFGAGRIFGIDSYLEDTEFVKRNPWLRYLTG